MKTINLLGLVFLTLFGLGGASLLALSFDRQERDSIDQALERQVQKKVRALNQTLQLNLEMLHTLKGGLDVLGEVEPGSFKLLARSVLSRHRDIHSFEWVPKVPHAERATFEATQQQKYPDFIFSELTAEGLMTQAKEREVYYPIYYIEPLSGNEMAFGFDLGSNEERFKALQEATDHGQMFASASVRLIQDDLDQTAFLAFLPVYRGIPTTVERRREQLYGFVLGVYRIQDLFDTALVGINVDDIQLELWDRTTETEKKLLMRSSPSPLAVKNPVYYERPLAEFAGRQWVLKATASEPFIAAHRSLLPVLIFVIGVLLTLLVGGYYFLLLRHAASVERQVSERTDELQQAKRDLETLSATDKLTGLANRHRFDEFFSQEWQRASRDDHTLSVMMIDVDYFKRYNDRYGHVAGDECLRSIAGMLQTLFKRSGDLVARYGGEEFVVVLPNTERLERLAQSCCVAVEALAIDHEDSTASEVVTVSIGTCTLVPSSVIEPGLLIQTADQALYQAKKTGRNRVVTLPAVTPS